MKIRQTVYIAYITLNLPPGDYSFGITEGWVVNFDCETVIVSQFGRHAEMWSMPRLNVFESPHQLLEQLPRLMEEYDSQGKPKRINQKQIDHFLLNLDQPTLDPSPIIREILR